jgi:HEAT repeat protein
MKMTLAVAAALLLCARGGWAQVGDGEARAGLVADLGFDDPDDDENPEDEAYEEGTDAIGDEEWADAVRAFDRVIALNGRRLDAALYWKAYAQAQAGNRTEALSAIGQLRAKAPKSRWLDDAKALEVEIRSGGGARPAVDASSDEETKIIALNSLMHSDAEEAVPMLERFLAGGASVKLKKKALFVLSQSSSPRARQVVTEIAKGGRSPQLQDEAVKYLGLFGGEQSRQALGEIYASSSDPAVKKQVLHSFMLSGDKARVLAAARGEKDPALREAAVNLLGIMGARAELAEMYRTETAVGIRKSIVHALFLSGSVDTLAEILRTEKDPEVREQAIHSLGLVGGPKSADVLMAAYRAESSAETRKKVMHALFLQGNSAALVQLAKSEANPELRKTAVHWLSLMGSKDARDYMMEILEK